MELDWPAGGGPAGADEKFAPSTKPMVSELEERHSPTRPIQAYPRFENALRAVQGMTLADFGDVRVDNAANRCIFTSA